MFVLYLCESLFKNILENYTLVGISKRKLVRICPDFPQARLRASGPFPILLMRLEVTDCLEVGWDEGREVTAPRESCFEESIG